MVDDRYTCVNLLPCHETYISVEDLAGGQTMCSVHAALKPSRDRKKVSCINSFGHAPFRTCRFWLPPRSSRSLFAHQQQQAFDQAQRRQQASQAQPTPVPPQLPAQQPQPPSLPAGNQDLAPYSLRQSTLAQKTSPAASAPTYSATLPSMVTPQPNRTLKPRRSFYQQSPPSPLPPSHAPIWGPQPPQSTGSHGRYGTQPVLPPIQPRIPEDERWMQPQQFGRRSPPQHPDYAGYALGFGPPPSQRYEGRPTEWMQTDDAHQYPRRRRLGWVWE